MRTLFVYFLITCLSIGTIAQTPAPTDGFPIRLFVDADNCYRVVSPHATDQPARLEWVRMSNPSVQVDQPLCGVGEITVEGNPIPWTISDNQLHYLALAKERPRRYYSGIVMISPVELENYRKVVPQSDLRWGAPMERLCTVNQLASRIAQAEGDDQASMHFDLYVDGPRRYFLYVRVDGKMEVTLYDLRASEIKDRKIQKVAEFDCDVRGPFHVFRSGTFRYLLDSQGSLFVVLDDSITRIGIFRAMAKAIPSDRERVIVHDTKTPFVALLDVHGDEFRPLEYTPSDVTFKNPMLDGDLTAQQKAAIQALLAPAPPPQDAPQTTAPASQPAK